MKTDNKMNNLKSTVISTRDARAEAFTDYASACLATDAAWDAYISACKIARAEAFTDYSSACLATDDAWDAYISACKIARNAAYASNIYEAHTYGCYADEDE